MPGRLSRAALKRLVGLTISIIPSKHFQPISYRRVDVPVSYGEQTRFTRTRTRMQK